MSRTSGFVIENGVLKRYKGPGGDVVIPESVTRIGSWAFISGCTDLTIHAPAGSCAEQYAKENNIPFVAE